MVQGRGNLGNGFKGRAARRGRMMRSRDMGYRGSRLILSPFAGRKIGGGFR